MCKPGRCFLPYIILWWMCNSCKSSESHSNSIPKEFDFRLTSYEQLREEADFLTHPDIVGFTQLTLDEDNDQLLVGARDSLFRLSLDNLTLKEQASLPAEDAVKCKNTGKPAESCHNFIRVLLLHNYTKVNSVSDVEHAVFVCGTNAFNPLCTWRPAENLSVTIESSNGIGKSPYNPNQNSTAIITTDGDIYGATNIGPGDRDPAIYRSNGPKSKELRTAMANSKWLNEPDFVSSYEIGDLVYFFFREVAVEFINCGKSVYSRVARLCKTDQGSSFENTWTTFYKSRLNCSLPGSYPFYYDEIQGTYLLDDGEEKYVYAVFNTPMNSIAGSAVCVFNLTAFQDSFNGPFKYQENPRAAWERHDRAPESKKLTQCPEKKDQSKRSNDNKVNMEESKYQLMDNAVQPTTEMPFHHIDNERWTHIVVDKVQAKQGMFHVVFVATADGKIRKMAKVGNETCIIEEIKIVPNGEHRPVKAMKISSKKMAVYISTFQNIIKVPVHRCARFKNRDLCLSANDPYCGWNESGEKCTPAPSGQPEVHFWLQQMDGCPVVSRAINGGWSDWTDWGTCSQVGEDPSAGDCKCRSRTCDNPAPFLGGRPCVGASVEVKNCTAHGHWTDWTPWSSCSQSCGSTALQHRHRYCSNPPPKFGGRPCVGPDSEEQYCQGHPPCPAPLVKGNWTDWTQWSQCSTECNGGIQIRQRSCIEPLISVDTIPCTGNTQEWRPCNTQLCEPLFKMTPWTPWVITNKTKGGYFQERYRFKCEAQVPSQSMIKEPKLVKANPQFCFDGGKCHSSDVSLLSDVDGAWSKWTEWTECSQDCDGGFRWRNRQCDNPSPLGEGLDCEGHTMEGQECNAHSCQGVWGCWSGLSACSVTCGQGVMTRTRMCDSLPPGKRFMIPCEGSETETADCDMGPCINIVIASQVSDGYIQKARFSLAQMFLVGGLSFILGGCAFLALYCYIVSFRRAMKEAKQNERKQKMESKLKEQQELNKRHSQISMKSVPSKLLQVNLEQPLVGRSNSVNSTNKQASVTRSGSVHSNNQSIRRSNSVQSSANQYVGRSRFYDMESLSDFTNGTIGRSKFYDYDSSDCSNENGQQHKLSNNDNIMTRSTSSAGGWSQSREAGNIMKNSVSSAGGERSLFYDTDNVMTNSTSSAGGRSHGHEHESLVTPSNQHATPRGYFNEASNIYHDSNPLKSPYLPNLKNQNNYYNYKTPELNNRLSPKPVYVRSTASSRSPSQISLSNTCLGKKSNFYNVETAMKDKQNEDDPYHSPFYKKCELKTFTIKDL